MFPQLQSQRIADEVADQRDQVSMQKKRLDAILDDRVVTPEEIDEAIAVARALGIVAHALNGVYIGLLALTLIHRWMQQVMRRGLSAPDFHLRLQIDEVQRMQAAHDGVELPANVTSILPYLGGDDPNGEAPAQAAVA